MKFEKPVLCCEGRMQANTSATEFPKASLAVYRHKTVLVTGHTGFVGSWLCLWLKRLGARVVGYALDPPSEPSLFETAKIGSKIDQHVIGDVRDGQKLLLVFRQHNPEVVFHLAAQPLVRLSYAQPKLTFETNVLGTLNILEAIRAAHGVRVCIIATSDKCYENQGWVYGYRETDALGGYDPYSASKACAELAALSYRRSFFDPQLETRSSHVTISTVRAGNIIGGGDWGQDRLLPDCVRALSRGRTIALRSPKAIRPWQFVLDSLSGYLCLGALMYTHPSEYAGAWNFGPDHEAAITVEQIVQMFLEHWGQGKYEVRRTDTLHENSVLRLDTSKANSLMAWRPVYSIRDAVRETAAWYRAFYANGRAHAFDMTVSQIDEYVQTAKAKGLPWREENIHALSDVQSQIG